MTKLVRRNLLPKFNAEGIEVTVVKPENMVEALKQKLLEETQEVLQATHSGDLLDEMGDVYEVLCVMERMLRKDSPVFQEFSGFVERSVIKRHKLGSFDQGYTVDITKTSSNKNTETTK